MFTALQTLRRLGPHTSRRLGFLTSLTSSASSRSGVRATVLTVALIVAGALCLSSCGGSSDNGVANKSAQEILAASKEAAEGASSVHVASKASQGVSSRTSDLELGRDGAHASNAFGLLSYELTRIGGTLYVKGPASFLEFVTHSTVKIPQGTWLKGPTNGKLAQLATLVNLPRTLNRMLSTPGTVIKGANTTVNGQKVIELKEATKIYKGSLYVATTGKPYPVLFVKSGGRETGRTTFSKWDKALSLTAPSPSVDVESLKG